MLSDETVQQEGVKALVTVAKADLMHAESMQFLMANVLSILYKKSKEVENAKVGALLLLEAFVREEIFGKDKCEEFIRDQLDSFLAQKLYKIKRPLLQCLVTISKHLDRDPG
jgi:trans-2-enoyl-CoA reductase